MAEHAGILGIQAEDQPHAQDVEPPERRGRIVVILGEQRVIELPDDLARLHRHLHLARDVLLLVVDKECQAVVLLAQVLEQDLLGLPIGPLHVIDEKLLKIARHNPARMLRQRHVGHIALGLLVGGEHRAVALLDGGTQVLAQRLLLNEHARRGDVTVDEVGGIDLDLFLITDKLRRVLHAIDQRQQLGPEQLALALLIALSRPALGKPRCGLCNLFLALVHAFTLFIDAQS